MTVSHMIYGAAGSPSMIEDAHGVCRLCGSDSRGTPFVKWVKDTFTNYDLLQPGEIICCACQFCASEQTPTLAERTGKDKPQKFRNYSHFVTPEGEWHPLTKGQKREMLALLQRSCPVAIIAESGQKHLFFRSVPAWWQFEEQRMLPDIAGLDRLIRPIEELYHGGLSKDAIQSGVYVPAFVVKFGVDRWLELEQQIAPHRQRLLFNLAVFLVQSPEKDGNI